MNSASTVYVELLGRLGNQLFQYAAARALAVRLGARLRLDARRVGQRGRNELELCSYPLRAEVASRMQLWGLRGDWWAPALVRRARGIERLVEPHFHYWRQLMDHRTGSVYLRGHWQSERYFDSIRAELLHDLVPRQPLSPDARAIAATIAQDSVSIHVRRGDYALDPTIRRVHPPLGPDYYARARDHLSKKVVASRYFVFSDDITWCREHLDFSGTGPVTFVSGSVHNAVEELELMRRCSHHIIANSSFSWWGAWLNKQAGKIVIAPQRWFGTAHRRIDDLLPADWHCL